MVSSCRTCTKDTKQSPSPSKHFHLLLLKADSEICKSKLLLLQSSSSSPCLSASWCCWSTCLCQASGVSVELLCLLPCKWGFVSGFFKPSIFTAGKRSWSGHGSNPSCVGNVVFDGKSWCAYRREMVMLNIKKRRIAKLPSHNADQTECILVHLLFFW